MVGRRDAVSSRADALPKNLIAPHPYRFTRGGGSGGLLSRRPVHAGRGDGEGVAAAQGSGGREMMCIFSY